jgi:hypothetical protein
MLGKACAFRVIKMPQDAPIMTFAHASAPDVAFASGPTHLSA